MEVTSTTDTARDAMHAWAHVRGLTYVRSGSLPSASSLLRTNAGGEPGPPRLDSRPARWSEHLSSGVLPGGVDGIVGHHSFLYKDPEYGVRAFKATVVVAPLLEGTRIVRGFHGRTHPVRVVRIARHPRTPLDKTVALPGGRFTWTAPATADERTLAGIFDVRVVAAIAALPTARYEVTQRDGWLSIALIDEHSFDPATLDALCELAAALAAGVRRAAAAQPVLAPGETVRSPGHQEPLGDDGAAAARRGDRARVLILGIFAAVGLVTGIPAGVAGAVLVGPIVGVFAFASLFALIFCAGLVLALVMGSRASASELAARGAVRELDSLADGLARTRGMYPEDPQAFSQRFPMPLFGSAQRVMRGSPAPGVDGRIVLWIDRNDPGPAPYWNVAVASGSLRGRPQAPYGATQVGAWIVVYERTTREGRSAARLDALWAEAARLADQRR